MSETIEPKKMVRRTVAIALGIICIILVASARARQFQRISISVSIMASYVSSLAILKRRDKGWQYKLS